MYGKMTKTQKTTSPVIKGQLPLVMSNDDGDLDVNFDGEDDDDFGVVREWFLKNLALFHLKLGSKYQLAHYKW